MQHIYSNCSTHYINSLRIYDSRFLFVYKWRFKVNKQLQVSLFSQETIITKVKVRQTVQNITAEISATELNTNEKFQFLILGKTYIMHNVV